MYQRAGADQGTGGSLTFIGTVSPAGGNFQEPVTQATMDATGGFLGDCRKTVPMLKNTRPSTRWLTLRRCTTSFISWNDRNKCYKHFTRQMVSIKPISTIGLTKFRLKNIFFFKKDLPSIFV